jgi:ABC-type phosphate transport system substrate-binding protein
MLALGVLVVGLSPPTVALGENNLDCGGPGVALGSIVPGPVCTEVATVVASTGRLGDDSAQFTLASDTSPSSFPNAALSGRGATFAGPLMTQVTSAYEAAETQGVTSAYGICGSSCGKRGFFGEPTTSDANTLNLAGRVVGTNPATTETDFCTTAQPAVDNTVACIQWAAYGASEAPLNNADKAKAASFGGIPLHLPFVIGTVTLSYRIDGLVLPAGESLKLNSIVLDRMYFGNIQFWDDAQIAALNPGATLPHTLVVPVHRCDGSGTTFAWTDFLQRSLTDLTGASRFSANEAFTTGNTCTPQPEVCAKTGGAVGVNVLRANTICGNGNPRVATLVGANNGAFGYVELGTAIQQGLAFAALQNRAGNFIVPSPASGTAAAAGVSTPQPWEDWSTFSLAWSDPADGYPASSFSYFLVWANPLQVVNPATGAKFASTNDVGAFWSCAEYGALKHFMGFALGDAGQALNAGVNAAAVDETTQARNLDAVSRFMNCGPHVTVTIPDVKDQGFPHAGFETNVRGVATAATAITASAFGPRDGTLVYADTPATALLALPSLAPTAIDGTYVHTSALVQAVLPDLLRGGYLIVFADVASPSVFVGYLPAAHDWVPNPANVAGLVGAHVQVEVVGQVIQQNPIVDSLGIVYVPDVIVRDLSWAI